MGLVVRIDGELVAHSGLQGSSVRRGGYEACSFRIPVGKVPRKGADVRVWDGLSTVWHGFVKDAGVLQTNGKVRGANVTAIGYGARNKGNPFSMVFMDRSLSKWRGPSLDRQVAVFAASRSLGSFHVSEGAEPGLVLELMGAWGSAGGIESGAYYDAPPDAPVAKLAFTWSTLGTPNGSDGNFGLSAYSSNDDVAFTEIVTDRLTGGTGGSVSTSFTQALELLFNFTYFAAAGVDGVNYQVHLTDLRVQGDHDLDTAVSPLGLEGLFARDIIEYAVKHAGFDYEIIYMGGEGADYVVPHAAYYTPTDPEVMIDDMVTLLGWNYGTWEPDLFGDTPRFMYGAPPTEVSCSVNYNDLVNPDINDDLLEQHTRAIILSQDVAGRAYATEVEKTHPGVPSDWVNTLVLSLGVTDTDEAQGLFLLALDQATTRSSGSTELPPLLHCAGGTRPSHLLKPGQDRLQVRGFPQADNWVTDTTGHRGDTFSISRLSFMEDDNGSIRTTVEVDSGADLTETLTARIDLGKTLSGVGG